MNSATGIPSPFNPQDRIAVASFVAAVAIAAAAMYFTGLIVWIDFAQMRVQ